MKSTAKNFQGLKSYAGLALHCGAVGYGFRKVCSFDPCIQAAFVFNSSIRALLFCNRMQKIHKVEWCFKRFFYRNNKFNYVVFVTLPRLFDFQNPQQKKLYTKSLRAFISCLGTTVVIGTNYSHPHKQHFLLTQSKAA